MPSDPLFTPLSIGTLRLPNRLLRSATWEGLATDDGEATEPLIDVYRTLARGGVGLILSGFMYVRPEGKSLPRQAGLHDDRLTPGWKRLTDAVHAEGGRVVAQIVHAGGQTSPETTRGLELLAPSSIPYPPHHLSPREISGAEIPELTDAFAQAARRAREAGFDGVQLHAAHGYLINRFLSPLSNRRSDGYGGSLPNRARFGLECLRAIRRLCPDDFPVLMKLNSEDFEPGGLGLEESLEAATLFAEQGVAHLEISGGTPGAGRLGAVRGGIDAPEKEAYFRENALRFARELSIPVGVVGGVRSHGVARSLIEAGLSTVSFSRPLVCEPDLPARWAEGRTEPAWCRSDSGCFVAGLKEGIRCVKRAKPE